LPQAAATTSQSRTRHRSPNSRRSPRTTPSFASTSKASGTGQIGHTLAPTPAAGAQRAGHGWEAATKRAVEPLSDAVRWELASFSPRCAREQPVSAYPCGPRYAGLMARNQVARNCNVDVNPRSARSAHIWRIPNMALYEFDCGKRFEVRMPMSAHADPSRAPRCPGCKRSETRQVFSAFSCKTPAG
jgi:putative FmdB family regulatory protein